MATLRRRAARLAFVPPVLLYMILAELTVRSVPVQRLSKVFGVPLDSTSVHAIPNHQPPSLTRWQRGQLRTLAPLAARWPFADGPCLRQSLVTGHVLRRHHPVLRLGVANPDSGLQAHAWVEVDGFPIGESSAFTPLINVRAPSIDQ